jgi:hypothetical protein
MMLAIADSSAASQVSRYKTLSCIGSTVGRAICGTSLLVAAGWLWVVDLERSALRLGAVGRGGEASLLVSSRQPADHAPADAHPVRNRTLVDQPRRPVALPFAPMFLDPETPLRRWPRSHLRVRSSALLGRSVARRHDVLRADPSSVRQGPAGRAAPVDRARQPTPMLPPGDPELAARRCSSFPPWFDHHPPPSWVRVLPAGSREPGQPRQIGLLLHRGDPLVGGRLGSGRRHGVAPGPTSTRPCMPKCSVQEYR